MSLPPFEVLRPWNLDAAVATLGRFGLDVKLVAGGTDLIPSMNQGLFAPKILLDLKGLRDLRFIRFDPERGLTVGAVTTISALTDSPVIARHFPVLHAAARNVASPLLRNMGTVGGNLCLDTRCLYYNQSAFWRQSLGGCIKNEGTICHVAPASDKCWAAFSGDVAPALLVPAPACVSRVQEDGVKSLSPISMRTTASSTSTKHTMRLLPACMFRQRAPAGVAPTGNSASGTPSTIHWPE